MKKIKIFIYMGLILVSLLFTSGCVGETDVDTLKASDTFNAIIQRNTSTITKLRDADVINSELQDILLTSMNTSLKTYCNLASDLETADFNSQNENDALYSMLSSFKSTFKAKKFYRLISDGNNLDENDGKYFLPEPNDDYYIEETTLNIFTLNDSKINIGDLNFFNALKSLFNKFGDSISKIFGNDAIQLAGEDDPGIVVFSDEDDGIALLKEALQGHVYVLKSDLEEEQFNELIYKLKELKSMTETQKEEQASNIYSNLISEYFVDSGKQLYDISDDTKLTKTSERPADLTGYEYNSTVTKNGNTYTLNNATPNTNVYFHAKFNAHEKDATEDDDDTKQVDVVIYQAAITELDAEFMEDVATTLAKTDKYIRVPPRNGDSNNYYLLMEYPIYKIKQFNIVNNSTWNTDWEYADMYLNIYNQQMVYYDDTQTGKKSGIELNKETSTEERLYQANLDNLDNSAATGHLSFILGDPHALNLVDQSAMDVDDMEEIKIGDEVEPIECPAKVFACYKGDSSTDYLKEEYSLFKEFSGPGYTLAYENGEFILTTGQEAKYKITPQGNYSPLSIETKSHIYLTENNEIDCQDFSDTDTPIAVKILRLNNSSLKCKDLDTNLSNLYAAVKHEHQEFQKDYKECPLYRLYAANDESQVKSKIRNYVMFKMLLDDLTDNGDNLSMVLCNHDSDCSWDLWVKAFYSDDTATLEEYRKEETNSLSFDSLYTEDEYASYKSLSKYTLLDVKYCYLNKTFSFSPASGSSPSNSEHAITQEERDNLDYDDGIDCWVYTSPTDKIRYKVEVTKYASEGGDGLLDDAGNMNTDIEVPTFKLTDYLELTYLPGAASTRTNHRSLRDEPFIATGRRVTLTKFESAADSSETSVEEEIGYYGDKKGNPLNYGTDNDYQLTVTLGDIIDMQSGSSDVNGRDFSDVAIGLDVKEGKEYVPAEAKTATNVAEAFIDADRTERLSHTLGLDERGALLDRKQLKYQVYQDKVNPILKFSSEAVGDVPALDGCDADAVKESLKYDTTSTMSPSMYYGICLLTNPYDTALYTKWIDKEVTNVDTDTEGSLVWWNKWLETHGYEYMIDVNNIDELLAGLYNVTLAEQNNTIVFNENVIEAINKDISSRREEHISGTVRTLQTFVGILLILYALLLILAWMIDINMTNGPGVLTKLTFGKCYAIENLDRDMPRMVENKIYADFKYVCILGIICIVLGVILIIFDMVTLIEAISKMFEGVITLFKKLILRQR